MTPIRRIDWIHPSCRDLVIEELTSEPTLQAKFVEKMSLQGIKLSVSDSGGVTGERRLPLLKDPRNWEILRGRCLSIAREDSVSDAVDLLTTLYSSALESSDLDRKDQFIEIIGEVCGEVCKRWNESSRLISADHLSAYCEASTLSTPFSPIPQLNATWESLTKRFRNELDRGEDGHLLDPDCLVEWMKFSDVVCANEPRFLKAMGFPNKFYADIKRFLLVVDSEVDADLLLDSSAECESEAERIELLEEVVGILDGFLPRTASKTVLGEESSDEIFPERVELKDEISKVSARLRHRAEKLKEKAADLAPPEPDYDDDRAQDTSDDRFDIDGLFLDL